MKPRCWLTAVCWALVCLVLGLIQQAGMYSSQVSGSSQWLDRCREPASGSPTASVVESTQFDPARAGPLTSLVLEDSWSKGNIGPPGQETHGPPKTIGNWRLPVKDGSSKQQRATLPQEIFDSADGKRMTLTPLISARLDLRPGSFDPGSPERRELLLASASFFLLANEWHIPLAAAKMLVFLVRSCKILCIASGVLPRRLLCREHGTPSVGEPRVFLFRYL